MCLFCKCSFWISPGPQPAHPHLPIHSALDSGIKNLDPPKVLHVQCLCLGRSSPELTVAGPFHLLGLSSSPTTSLCAYSATLGSGWQSSTLSSGFLPPVADGSEPISFICLVGICFPHPQGISGRERFLSVFCLTHSRCSVPICGVKQNYNHERIFAVWVFAATKEKW